MSDRLVIGEGAALARGHLISAVVPLQTRFPHVDSGSPSVDDLVVETQWTQRQLLDGARLVIGAGSEQLAAFIAGMEAADTALASGAAN